MRRCHGCCPPGRKLRGPLDSWRDRVQDRAGLYRRHRAEPRRGPAGTRADLLLAEATFVEQASEAASAYHTNARQAGRQAMEAQGGRLVLTHLWPGNDPVAARRVAGEAFAGPIETASAGLVVDPALRPDRAGRFPPAPSLLCWCHGRMSMRAPARSRRCRSCGTRSVCCAATSHDPSSNPPIVRSSRRSSRALPAGAGRPSS